MEPKTHWKKLCNPDYIGAYSLEPGEERVVQIVSVSREMVMGAGGKKEECTVAKLKNEKPFILNRTNCKTIAKLYNSPYIEEWAGKLIKIYAAKVQAFGENTEALRIKNELPKLEKPVIKEGTDTFNRAKAAIAKGEYTIEKLRTMYQMDEQTIKALQS